MVGRLVSFWDGLFPGAMLVSGRVCLNTFSTHAKLYIRFDLQPQIQPMGISEEQCQPLTTVGHKARLTPED